MKTLLRDFRDFFVSLKLTVTLLALSIVLVFWATWSQQDLGVWGVQHKFFHSLFVLQRFGSSDIPIPVFPGGYFIGGLLLINLIAAHVYRFRFSWKKTGIVLAHTGLILLLVGELLSGLMQREYNMRLDEGQTKNYSESPRIAELAITDVTDPKTDDVVVIPEDMLARGDPIQYPKLPFRVITKAYFPNSELANRTQAPDAPTLATKGIGLNVVTVPVALTYKEDERNIPSAFVELDGPDGPLGTWMVSAHPLMVPQHFEYGGRSWKIALRFKRLYHPFTLTLLKFSHDVYPGTDIPKNFSSRVRIHSADGHEDREALIYMNNPLRYAGLTFYQASYDGEHTTILQVVRNPSWLMPYIACAMVALGLLIQFGIHLVGFSRKRTQTAAVTNKGGTGDMPDAATVERHSNLITLVAVLGAVAWVGTSLRPASNAAQFNVADFGRLPVLANGRIKPIDTVARTSLLQIQHRQAVSKEAQAAAFGGKTDTLEPLTAAEWLLDVSFRPELADKYQVFRIVSSDVLTIFDLKATDGRDDKYFSFAQLSKHVDELERQAKLAQSVESATRSSFQRAVLQLYDNLVLYQRLHYTFAPPDRPDILQDLLQLQQHLGDDVASVRAKQAGQPHDEAAAQRTLDLGREFELMSDTSNILIVPPADPKSDPSGWKSAGAALLDTFTTGRVSAHALAYAGLGHAWRVRQVDQFNTLLKLYRGDLEKRLGPALDKAKAETRFNAADVFTHSFTLYAMALVAAIVSCLVWPRTLGRIAFWLLGIAWLLATAGILTRMWLEGRPPVTNLYSSALFVGWMAVLLCLVLERTYRNAIGSAAGGMIGFATLIIADRLQLNGDTLEMMRAVLDSNFWLATHVVVVASGYAATFLAGFLALIYVVRGVFTRSLDKATADSLVRMVYGIVCFATLFSFTGTVLGGIWADQSWGRFWGWDPKENGALIIVVWNAIILHARWGGMVKQRGLMNLAIFGNIVTSWSWFGTNMLGIGLHSYGFTEAAFWGLLAFVFSQLAFIAIGSIPLEKWRSFRVKAVKAAEPVAAM